MKGVRLSRINAKLKQPFDLTPFLSKLQQNDIIRIIFYPAVDEEPLVHLTQKGRQELIELLFSQACE
jgi:hypothetical protein